MKHLIILLALFILFSASAQEVSQKHVVYKQIDGQDLKAGVFHTLSDTNTSKPALAFFHGGGWAFGSPEEFHGACKRYARKGFKTFSFQYRLAQNPNGETPNPDITPIECTKDARSALRWLKANADSLQIDANKIIVGGQSVGGQLAMSTAMCEELNEQSDDLTIDPTPAAIISYSGTVNTVTPWCDYLLGAKRNQIRQISPYHNMKKGMPPTIAFHGKADKVVDFWTVGFFQRETKELGNYFELVSYEERTHYLGENDEKGKAVYSRLFDEEIMQRTDEFLKKYGFME